MPWYRFLEDARVRLPYRNGAVLLAFANLQSVPGIETPGPEGEGVWGWVAHYESDWRNRVVLLRRGNTQAMSLALMNEGFPVELGSAAHRIMQAAVKLGHAEALPEDAGRRAEVLRGRWHAYRR